MRGRSDVSGWLGRLITREGDEVAASGMGGSSVAALVMHVRGRSICSQLGAVYVLELNLSTIDLSIIIQMRSYQVLETQTTLFACFWF